MQQLLYFEFFEFYIFSIYADGIGTSVDLNACCRRDHFELVGRGRDCDVTIHQYRTLRVGDDHTCLDGIAPGVLITEAEGILLAETRFDDEGRPPLSPRLGGRLVGRSRAGFCVLRQLLFRQFGNGICVEGTPDPSPNLPRGGGDKGRGLFTAWRGNVQPANESARHRRSS